MTQAYQMANPLYPYLGRESSDGRICDPFLYLSRSTDDIGKLSYACYLES